MLNPKTALFFLAFLPQFVDTDAARSVRRSRSSGSLFAAIAFALATALYALLADLLAGRLRRKRPRRDGCGASPPAGSSSRSASPAAAAHRTHVTRVPLLADARIVVAEPGAGRPRPPPAARARGARRRPARRCATRFAFPLAGPPLERLVTRGGTATLVIEQPSLPIPAAHARAAAPGDRRGGRRARAARRRAADDPRRRRPAPPDVAARHRPALPTRVPPAVPRPDRRARRRGRRPGRARRQRRHRRCASTRRSSRPTWCVAVTAAETVLDGGPGALLGATGPRVAARVHGAVAARDQRFAGLAPRARARATARSSASP